MTWIKAIGILTSFLDGIRNLYNAYLQKKMDAARQKQIDEITAATDLIVEANKIEDVNERLRKKAEAAKALEDSISNVPK